MFFLITFILIMCFLEIAIIYHFYSRRVILTDLFVVKSLCLLFYQSDNQVPSDISYTVLSWLTRKFPVQQLHLTFLLDHHATLFYCYSRVYVLNIELYSSFRKMELYYGISLPENSDYDEEKVQPKKYYTDKSEVMKVLKEIKGTRFKVFKSQAEAEEYSASHVPAVPESSSDPSLLSSPKPSEKSEFKSLKSQQEVQFRKAIEKSPSDLEFLSSCIEENARYLVTPSDTPTILHQGPRHNALHVAAKHGKEEAARLVLSQVTGGLMSRMYPAECPVQNQVRRDHLVDLYLNMPDKGGGDTPLHLASKFGRLELVKLLCSYHQTRLDLTNRNQETALAVVCSRAGDDVTREQILTVMSGQLVIPVYKAVDTKQLGRPISLRQAADMLDISDGEESFSSQFNVSTSPLVQSSRARLTPDLRSPQLTSPLGLRSPLANSPLVNSPSLGTISAVLGPVPASQAERLWRSWKVSPARERLEDPALGLERQGRRLADREGVEWLEYWPWLGEYADLTSHHGLALLENHLEEKFRSAREIVDRENEDDLVEELEATIFLGDSGRGRIEDDLVFGNGELEFVSKASSFTPLIKVENWSRLETKSVDDNRFSDNNNQPLSPLSSIMTGLHSLNLDNQKPEKVDNILSLSGEQSSSTDTRQRVVMGGEVRRSVEQFVVLVVQRLAESFHCQMTEEEVKDWVEPVTSHWTQLRRQVNNWRSDPQARWSSVHWGQVGLVLVEMMRDQVILELGTGLEKEKFGEMLGSVVWLEEVETESEEEDQDERYKRGRRLEPSRTSDTRDISRLCRLVSRSLLSPGTGLSVKECEEVWDLVTDQTKSYVSTANVNRARKFLHSSSESGRVRRESGGSQISEASEEDWATPPCSPEGSVTSMRTCSEPIAVWVVGDTASTQDRRVQETLESITREQLAAFPSISQYLAQLASYSRETQLSWRDPDNKPSDKSSLGGLARRLDLNVTFE